MWVGGCQCVSRFSLLQFTTKNPFCLHQTAGKQSFLKCRWREWAWIVSSCCSCSGLRLLAWQKLHSLRSWTKANGRTLVSGASHRLPKNGEMLHLCFLRTCIKQHWTTALEATMVSWWRQGLTRRGLLGLPRGRSRIRAQQKEISTRRTGHTQRVDFSAK